MTRFAPSSPAPDSPFYVSTTMGGTPASPTWSAIVAPGRVLERRRATEEENMLFWEPYNLLTDGQPTRFTASVGYAIYVRVTENIPGTDVTAVAIATGATDLQSVETFGSDVIFYYKLAEFITMPDGSTGCKPFMMGSHIYHWPEGKGLNLKVSTWDMGPCGFYIPKGSEYDVTHYWRKGAYVGVDDPGTDTDYVQEVTKMES